MLSHIASVCPIIYLYGIAAPNGWVNAANSKVNAASARFFVEKYLYFVYSLKKY